MEILGTGIDLVENARMASSIGRFGDRFLERVFLPGEIAYCRAMRDPAPHYAARFAAKEALSKAFGCGIGASIGFRDVEVIRADSGAPSLRLHGGAAVLAGEWGVTRHFLSLSHTEHYAMAQVILTGGGRLTAPAPMECPFFSKATIQSRLEQMRCEPKPEIWWDEACEGSAKAMAIFVGPSPAGPKPTERLPMKKSCWSSLWNESFDKPLSWSAGFRTSFRPLTEAIFDADFQEAGRLIGRANMDWMSCPEADDVSKEHMMEGAPSVLAMIEECLPELVLAMESKSFQCLEKAMKEAGYLVVWSDVKRFHVRISESGGEKFHRLVYSFHATTPKGHDMIVMKLPQHPARIFNADYATRCGKAVREAAFQMASGRSIDVTVV